MSRPSSSSFHYQGLCWRHLAVREGMTKDQGLCNKPSAAVHLGALAARTLPQYNCQFLHSYIVSTIKPFMARSESTQQIIQVQQMTTSRNYKDILLQISDIIFTIYMCYIWVMKIPPVALYGQVSFYVISFSVPLFNLT